MPLVKHYINRVGWLRASVLGANDGILSTTTLVFLVLLGAVAARAGGNPAGKSVLRISFWGTVAMGVTAIVGYVFGTAIS